MSGQIAIQNDKLPSSLAILVISPVGMRTKAALMERGTVLALTLAALAVGLGNFGAAISIGLSGAPTSVRLRVAAVFGLFEAGMPMVGLLLGHRTTAALSNVAGYVGGGLLIVIGAWQFIQVVRSRGESEAAAAPSSSLVRLLLTAFALSMDNLVVGFSLGVQHVSLVEAIAVFAAVSVALSLIGLEFGRRLGAAVEFGVEYVAGLVLVCVGVLIVTGEF
jgi:manganese efflux pump family protein